MPKSPPDAAPPRRKLRADAQRNRERLLEAAKAVFARDGAEANLEAVTAEAGVGPGTLYRHFATRDLLIEAVYRSEVERLAAAARQLAEKHTPVEALRAWMLLFVEHVEHKKLIIPAMDTVAGGSMRLIEGSRGLIHSTFTRAVQDAIASGALRADTQPEDFVRALIGVFHTTAMPGWEQSARRLIDILIAGCRAEARYVCRDDDSPSSRGIG